jgi:hypothetical protein
VLNDDLMKFRLLPLLAMFAGLVTTGSAATFTFSFNPLSSGANSSAIATYMDGVLGCTGCVTVTGAVADRTYTGEGFVVGPNGKPATLGTTDGATSNSPSSTSCPTSVTTSCADTFISNTADNSSFVSSEMSIVFSLPGGDTISNVSFDYEIFPDGTCPTLSNCGTNHGNLGDFTFTTGTDANPTQVFETFAVAPSSATSGNPANTGGDGTSTKDGNTTISAPQFIGTTGVLTVNKVSELNFVDWPATIGVDNLTITTVPPDRQPPVPEPSSVVLLATASLGALAAMHRKFRKQA